MRFLLSFLFIASFILYSNDHVFAQFVARHNISVFTFQTEHAKWTGQGYRLADISIYSMNGSETYAAIWNKESGPAWTERHAMTEQGYKDTVTYFTNQGYRPQRITSSNIGGSIRFACIFFKTTAQWVERNGLTASQFQTEFNNWAGQGYRLIDVCGYNKGGVEMYAAVWEKSPGAARLVRHGMSNAQYKSEYQKQDSTGYKIARISGFEIGGQDRYAAIWEKKSLSLYSKHSMDAQTYQAEFNNNAARGAALVHVNGYTVGGHSRFAAIWIGAQ